MKKLQVSKVFSRGIAVGPVFCVKEVETKIATYQVNTKEEKDKEIDRFEKAKEKVLSDLFVVAADNPIFQGHVAIVSDFMLTDQVKQKIEANQNAEAAVSGAITELKQMFEAMDDEYMRGRAADMVDVGDQLIAALQNRSNDKFASLNQRSVIVARDLYPSDTARIDLDKVAGFITEEGGVTSHVSIMAKSLGIPALVGVVGILDAVEGVDKIVFDAETGEIYLDPDDSFVDEYVAKQKQQAEQNAKWLEAADKPAKTLDGHEVKIYANVGNISDVEKAVAQKCTGVGLFRSEFLYMENDHFPTEEEQFNAYKQAVETLGGEMIIRTLDIGGDKALTYYTFEAEENPFLGFRAIRMCLAMPEILITQFKALLRAAKFGTIKIMLPMLISLDEAKQARELLEKAKDELQKEGKEFAEQVELGMMIETPAAVMLADDFAKEMDFFSIGTNDLTQYVLAVDRGNKKINQLYNSFDPAVLRAISTVIDAGHRAGIEVGMCGEFASDSLATKLLLGLGLDEFSMASSETPRIKQMVRELNYEECAKRARDIIKLSSASAILEAVKAWN